MTVNLFVLSTGFQYYFSTLLIEHLGLEQVSYAMYQPREGIERRAALRYPVVHVDASDPLTRLFGKKAGKRRFAHRVFGELGLRGQQVRVFCPYYNESFVYALQRRAAAHERGLRAVAHDQLDAFGVLDHRRVRERVRTARAHAADLLDGAPSAVAARERVQRERSAFPRRDRAGERAAVAAERTE